MVPFAIHGRCTKPLLLHLILMHKVRVTLVKLWFKTYFFTFRKLILSWFQAGHELWSPQGTSGVWPCTPAHPPPLRALSLPADKEHTLLVWIRCEVPWRNVYEQHVTQISYSLIEVIICGHYWPILPACEGEKTCTQKLTQSVCVCVSSSLRVCVKVNVEAKMK